ncbi:RidA family protein [Virgibacillus kimchii]
MQIKEFINPDSLVTPVGPYSHGVRWGKLVIVSGQLPLDNETARPLNDEDIKEQTRIVLSNIRFILEQVGSSIDNVLKTTVYLTSLDEYKEMNEVYNDFFKKAKPARATLQVAGLIGDVKVEIEAIAVIPD